MQPPALARRELESLGVAAVWVSPPRDPCFRFDRGAGEHFDAMMAALANESGYDELRRAPVERTFYVTRAGKPVAAGSDELP